ncbi:Dihydrolipoyllysine-residue acetyltransferase component of pyruvate dehydrogenase complex [Methylobrevis pamukkalensis]|uniref:Dihydrolipoyllysine-residue acetyltransferase component of pyruvate dehydrogenase complex n=1 Tax=Methylobrevis pamukkalensis TaxID=1439726 RepID=A0A1E3H4F2_9HYPH|nr:Dihydrolipoyllysine-residue acetyltransferase component of pyruvate dehydrogenase complex [Methylobrevis pamukkalensis]
MAIDITLNGAGGEYMESATVVAWEVAPGASVKRGDLLVTVETAKAATEVEAPDDGVFAEILAPVGTEVAIGTVLGRLATAGEAVAAPVAAAPATAAHLPVQLSEPEASPKPFAATDRIVASPLARRIAKEKGIDLAAVAGSGPRGRIKLRDLPAEGASASAVPAASARPASTAAPSARPVVVLVHGFGADRFAWRSVKRLLEDRFDVHTPELLAHGDRGGTATDLDELAAALEADLLAAGTIRSISSAIRSAAPSASPLPKAAGSTCARSR